MYIYDIIILSKGKPKDNMVGKNRKGGLMQEVMTDKQMEFIANLIADKFETCKTMEDVKDAIKRVREMASKDKQDK